MNLHISNTTKVWFFLVATSLGILFLGYHFGGRLGLFISFLLMSFLNFIVFIYGKAQIIKKLDAKLQSGQDPWRINEKLENFSKVLAMEKPLLFIVEEPTAIAFSLATPWQNASIGLSTGLINKLTEDELNTVLAHEICHIQRHDTFAFSVSSSIANTFIGFAQFLDQFWVINLMQNRMVQRPFLTMLSPIAWPVTGADVVDEPGLHPRLDGSFFDAEIRRHFQLARPSDALAFFRGGMDDSHYAVPPRLSARCASQSHRVSSRRGSPPPGASRHEFAGGVRGTCGTRR